MPRPEFENAPSEPGGSDIPDMRSIPPDRWAELVKGVAALQADGVLEPTTYSPDRNPPNFESDQLQNPETGS